MQISFMTANFVARQVGYHMDGGWGQGDKSTHEHFKPKTFRTRLEAYLNDIRVMDFEAIDMWTSIINPSWVTDDRLDMAVDLLEQCDLSAVSLAGGFCTQAYDAAQALEDLGPHLVHVHLKDVLKPGEHETCRYGQGVVPIRECVETLRRIGYTGAISVEHEPDFYDPTEDGKANLQMLREWLQ